jgi:hypothetical protein
MCVCTYVHGKCLPLWSAVINFYAVVDPVAFSGARGFQSWLLTKADFLLLLLNG